MTQGSKSLLEQCTALLLAAIMKETIYIVMLLFTPLVVSAQKDSIKSKLSFNGDFRFRIEQDWDSKKSDGTFRDDRTRFRYRLRAGLKYQYNQWVSVGARIRTGDPMKQQDPQLTLGDGFKEFGTLPIGFEKVFFEIKWATFLLWAGKNTFPFKKSNELLWSDNVYPEGVFIKKKIQLNSDMIHVLDIRGGYFIINSKGESLSNDSYFHGWQVHSTLFENRIELFPSIYLFKNIPNIPDGNETFQFDYSVLHLGTRLKPFKNLSMNFGFDYYYNLQDYSQNDSIPSNLKNQKEGVVVSLSYGKLDKPNDWTFKSTFTYLQQYAAVDFLAQNDWARWDYSSFASPDGRLTNFKGIELVGGYMIAEKIRLKVKYYLVEQIVAYGPLKETGNRVRLDLDIRF